MISFSTKFNQKLPITTLEISNQRNQSKYVDNATQIEWITQRMRMNITVSISSLTFRRFPSIHARCSADSPFSLRCKSTEIPPPQLDKYKTATATATHHNSLILLPFAPNITAAPGCLKLRE